MYSACETNANGGLPFRRFPTKLSGRNIRILIPEEDEEKNKTSEAVSLMPVPTLRGKDQKYETGMKKGAGEGHNRSRELGPIAERYLHQGEADPLHAKLSNS